jgi:hypothetical protein
MKELSDCTVLVSGHGLEISIAKCFAKKSKRVLYFSPYEEGFSTIRKGIIGDGFENIERCKDIWLAKREVDLWVFPDLHHAGEQLELESQGYSVWGSRQADSIELNRQKFLRLLKETGLDVPEYTVITGLTALRDFLKDKEDLYIKISEWRGDVETTHWRNWGLDQGTLDWWAIKFGPDVKEYVPFIVFKPIDTDLEIGGDTYCVDGQFPKTMLHGIEWKDKSYFASVTPTAEMPEQIQAVMAAFGPIVAPYRYRNQMSMEVRVKDDQFYYIDPTHRLGLPSTSSQLALWTNFPEIVYHGAHGDLIEPEYDDLFSMECVLTLKGEKKCWGVTELPKELEEHVDFGGCCYVDGRYNFPPDDSHGEEVGWLRATGKTPRATLDRMKELVKSLPEGLNANVESLADILKEIESEEEQGINFTDKVLPEPAEVIED